MAAIDGAFAVKMINATLPVGTSGAPGATITAMATSPMKIRLDSVAPTTAAAGTELSGSGYTTGGLAVPGQSTAASGTTASVLLPFSAMTWVNGSGGTWTINGLDITDSAALRSWFGTFTGAPISVANLNSFQIAANAITVTLL